MRWKFRFGMTFVSTKVMILLTSPALIDLVIGIVSITSVEMRLTMASGASSAARAGFTKTSSAARAGFTKTAAALNSSALAKAKRPNARRFRIWFIN